MNNQPNQNRKYETGYPSIGDSFQEIGNQFQQSKPRIMIGRKEESNTGANLSPLFKKDSPSSSLPPNRPVNPIQAQHQPFPPQPNLFTKLGNIGFVVALLCVIVYAGYRIILSLG